MIQEFRYRSPYNYLIVGLSSLIASSIFGLAIGADKIWFSIVIGIFCLMTLAMGVAFLAIFINNFSVGKLRIGKDFIEIPGRWKKRTKLDLNDIESIGEINTYDQVIEIDSKEGFFLIEQQWMKNSEFNTVREFLLEWSEKNFSQQR
jgi:hypothetical protein